MKGESKPLIMICPCYVSHQRGMTIKELHQDIQMFAQENSLDLSFSYQRIRRFLSYSESSQGSAREKLLNARQSHNSPLKEHAEFTEEDLI